VSRRAVFLDRDGTLVHARHYPTKPCELVVYDDLAAELMTLQAAGFALVVVTNQSGIARGRLTIATLDLLHNHLHAELAASGIVLDAIYFCPHHPEGIVSEYAVDCTCRKPQPGMLLQAAHELDIDLAHSWLVGDILDDVEAGNRASCRTVLVDLGTESQPSELIRCPDYVARSTVHAVQIISSVERGDWSSQLFYLPLSWINSAASYIREDSQFVATTAGGEISYD
jgi:D-glycero-D-manno-heptose 1,7-bisphosphate phosphatase